MCVLIAGWEEGTGHASCQYKISKIQIKRMHELRFKIQAIHTSENKLLISNTITHQHIWMSRNYARVFCRYA